MTDSLPRRITGSGVPQGTAPTLLSETPPIAETVSCNQDQVGARSRSVTVIGTERRYTRPRHQGAYVPVRCGGCSRAESTVRRLPSSGLSRDQIIARAKRAVAERRKGWPRIESRLASMTYSMPGHVIVTPYKGGSSTTA